jgi:DNA segregation ATPase FtsK/SpoIIIE, S-DNA-T family
MSTPTLVGTPDPDDNHPTTHSTDTSGTRGTGEAGRVIDFPGDRPPPITATATVVDPDPGTDTPVGPVVEAVIVDDPDPDEVPVPVDQPASRGAAEALPWRREIERRPIIAPWLKRADDVLAAARWLAGWVWHATGFHVVRLPLYLVKLTVRAPRGMLVAGARLRGWVGDAESAPLREGAIRAGEPDQWLRLNNARMDRVRVRRRLGAAAALASGAAVLALHVWAPHWLVWSLSAVLVLLLGWVGTPADRPLTGPSVVRTQVQRLTSEVVTRALGALGLAELNKAFAKGGAGVTFPNPITRDGPGWRADVDLPYGVTVSDIIERRDRLASGLRRPLGCVWPEPASEAHAGRLVLWVGDQDMATAKPKPWPLAQRGSADLFRPVPFGTDQRGRPVFLTLVFESVLIGAKPRMGKTFAMRVVLLAAALDPTVQLRTFELKGTGDLSMVEHCCHHYGSGADTATLDACMDSLRDLYTELDKRAATIRKLPRELCPENRVTPQLSGRRTLGLFLIAMFIDECQELFTHPDYKDEAARLVEAIIKRGPALGIMLILATQRPDAASLPTGVSANVGIRFCLRVMGQTENDMVLGTSAYKNGLRATTFGPRDKGIGYLVGAGDDPQIVRTAYLDGPAAEAIGARARNLREAAGTLSGHALGQEDDDTAMERARRSILADIAAVFGPDEDRLWSETIAQRLAEQWPTTYQGTTPASLAASLKPYGLAPAQVWGTAPDTGESRNRRGYLRDAVTTAWMATRPQRGRGDEGARRAGREGTDRTGDARAGGDSG